MKITATFTYFLLFLSARATSNNVASSTLAPTPATLYGVSPATTIKACNRDNCFRQLIQQTAKGGDFCRCYTNKIDTATTALPSFVANCRANPSRISSACSCLYPATKTGQPVSTPSGNTVPAPWSLFNQSLIFRPGLDFREWKSIYARTIQLPDGSILLTWENWPVEPPLLSWPIYKSWDGGATWSNISQVIDTANGWGNRWQPNLYLLQRSLGRFKAGTVLISGMSVKADLSAGRLEVYASQDGGVTWEYVSRIGEAGKMTTKDGDKAMWEPFFYVDGDTLICYYSDQRDPLHSQKLVHQTTQDLENWSPVVNDVAFPKFGARPGMAVVAHIKETNKYIMTFEYVRSPTGGSPVWFKIADDPFSFGAATAYPVKSTRGDIPSSSPYIIWIDAEDTVDGKGLLVMNAASHDGIWVNDANAGANTWKLIPSGQRKAHTRTLEVISWPCHERKLMITGGGIMSRKTDNYISNGVINIPKY